MIFVIVTKSIRRFLEDLESRRLDDLKNKWGKSECIQELVYKESKLQNIEVIFFCIKYDLPKLFPGMNYWSVKCWNDTNKPQIKSEIKDDRQKIPVSVSTEFTLNRDNERLISHYITKLALCSAWSHTGKLPKKITDRKKIQI